MKPSDRIKTMGPLYKNTQSIGNQISETERSDFCLRAIHALTVLGRIQEFIEIVDTPKGFENNIGKLICLWDSGIRNELDDICQKLLFSKVNVIFVFYAFSEKYPNLGIEMCKIASILENYPDDVSSFLNPPQD